MSGPSPYQSADDPVHDLGPWVELQSSRCKATRYDYATKDLQVSWINNKHHFVTTYYGVGSDVYRRLCQSASPGRFVNRVLNGYGYAPSVSSEKEAPSNPNRNPVAKRAKPRTR